MAISEIPSKIIERTESLTESKLHVASELTKIIYTNNKENITEERVLKTYVNFYNSINNLVPLVKISQKNLNLYLITGTIISVISFVLYVFFILKH